MTASADQSWKRQAAIFALVASAITGLGVALGLFFSDRRDSRPSPAGAPAAIRAPAR